MSGDPIVRSGFVLPLPRWVLQPATAAVVAAVHVYLAFGHLSLLFGGDLQWVHFWKGFGALGGAYVFAALASRGWPVRQVAAHTGSGAGGSPRVREEACATQQ